MTEMLVHGDAEALVVDILINHTPELASFSPTVSTDLRGYTAMDRWVIVTAEGGSHSQWNVINKPRMDFECRAERRDVAHDITQICLGSVYRAVPHTAYGATMTAVKTELGPLSVPDKVEEESYRYIFSLRIVCLVDPGFSLSS